MNAVIVIDDSNQDKGLRIAFDTSMQEKEWEQITKFENSYIKNFNSSVHHEILKIVQTEIDNVVFNAEWKNLKYILITTNTTFTYMTAK